MKDSGITRRIDDLGRIVVPKELRNNLGIRDGEPLLISTQDDTIIINKYSKMIICLKKNMKHGINPRLKLIEKLHKDLSGIRR